MKNVVLVACVATKNDEALPAEELYASDLFNKSMAYAHRLTDSDNIFILSAKHHLLPIRKVIKPYDMTLNDFSKEEKEEWADVVMNEIENRYDIDKTNFIFLAGNNYRKYLQDRLPHTKVPLEGLRIGQQKAKLKQLISEVFNKIKQLFKEELKKFKR
jgi:hypothetical protein